VDEGTTLKLKQEFVVIAIAAILLLSILYILPGELVFKFNGGDG
jgi:hypothetical protein